jgi:hypothetical protein
MGVTYQPDARVGKRWRGTIERHGEKKTAWFGTRQAAELYVWEWEQKLLKKYGPRLNKKIEELNARRAAKAARKIELDKNRVRTLAVPCGVMARAPYMNLNNKRCRDGDECPNYLKCLDTAAAHNWPGWVAGGS